VELKVINSLTQPESRGVVKQKNMMDLGELLNPEDEQDLLKDISEESVFEAVQLMNDSGQVLRPQQALDDFWLRRRPT
jgi:hypothetical protein